MIDFNMLHGFFGRGSDWDPIKEKLRQQYKDAFFRQPDLFSQEHNDISPSIGISNWGAAFNAWTREEQASVKDHKRVLMGYSMGGRLALHALMQRQGLWDAAVIMSANPGVFFTDEDRQERERWEEEWALNFLEEEWDYLQEIWNMQPIFVGDKQPYQLSQDQFSRTELSYAIQNWSLLQHGFDLEELKKMTVPVLWMVGEKDQKYIKIYDFLKNEGVIEDYVVIPQARHRLLRSDHPDIMLNISLFLSQHL